MKSSMMTIKEIAQLAGITVRTLHYYDEIGLLEPTKIEDNGYRLYNERSLITLQQVLFFRELGFPLKQIKQIMQSESYNKDETLKKHRQMLVLKRERLDGLISLVDKTLEGSKVSFKEFDITEIEQHRDKYAEEVRNRWGDSKAYKQSESRTSKYNKSDWQQIDKQSKEIFKGFAACMKREQGSDTPDELVKKWQDHITKYYYDCSDEILLGLSDMYVQDQRFKKNIDKYGAGLAEFMSESIKNYLSKS